MKTEEIIAMAIAEGLSFVPEANSPLVRIVKKAVQLEREACAQVCDELAALNRVGAPGSATWEQEECAAAIRARGEA